MYEEISFLTTDEAVYTLFSCITITYEKSPRHRLGKLDGSSTLDPWRENLGTQVKRKIRTRETHVGMISEKRIDITSLEAKTNAYIYICGQIKTNHATMSEMIYFEKKIAYDTLIFLFLFLKCGPKVS